MAINITKIPIPATEKGQPGGVCPLDPITNYVPLQFIDPSIGGQGDVLSVNNIDPDAQGNVDITTTDIPEGNKLYYTQGRFDTAFSTAIIPTTQSINNLSLELQAEIVEREGNDLNQINRISALENDHVTLGMFAGHENRLDAIEIDLPAEIQNRINDVEDLQAQITAEINARIASDTALDSRVDDVEAHHLHANSFYANDGLSDIQTEIDNVGASQGQIVWVTSGSFGGDTVLINDKVNMGLIAPDVGNTICELSGGRGLTISGASERIRIANLQIEGTFTVNGSKGRHVFSDCEFLGGVTIDGVTDTTSTFITFQDCSFENQNINLANLSNCIVYFNRCSFNNRRVITTNCTTTPYVGIIAEGSLLNTLQTPFAGGIALAGRNDYSNGVVKVYSTSSNFISALGVETSFTGSYTELLNKPTLVTSSTQLSDSASLLRTSDKGVANGVAELDANGLIPNHHLPPLALSKPYVVNTIAERDALTVEMGDVAIVTNDPTPANNGNYIYDADAPSWIKLYNATAPVDSVNGSTGTVTLYTGDISEGVGANSQPSQLYFTNQRAIDAVVTSDIDTNDKAPSTQTVKSYVTGITDALDTRLDSVETDALTHATITYVDNALTGKVNVTDYTANDVLTKLLTVDGSGTLLDADLLDGLDSADFVQIGLSQTITGDKEFSGVLTAVTQTTGDASTKVATTAFVADAVSGFTSLDGVRTAVGLTSSDTWSLPSSHYLAGSSVITDALNTLDGQIYNNKGIETSIKSSAGFNTNGTKNDFTSTYYIGASDSLLTAINTLDTSLNTVAQNAPQINALSDIANVNVNEDLSDDGKYLKWDNATSKWVADSVPAGYTSNDAKDDVGGMLELATGDITFTYDALNRTISTSVSAGSVGITQINGFTDPTVTLVASDLETAYTASNYTPTATHIKGHLEGIDSAFLAKAGLGSNTFTGDNEYDASYTLALSDNSKKFATTAFVTSKLGSLTGALIYKGGYNASTATPALTSSVIGDVYVVTAAGTLAGQTLISGDLVIFKANVSGGVVQSSDFNVVNQAPGVSSVNSLTGDVTVNGANIDSAVSPTNYTIANAKIDSHLSGINTKLGNVVTASGANTFTGTNTFTGSVSAQTAPNFFVPTAGVDYSTNDVKAVNRIYLSNWASANVLTKANNLSGIANIATARGNLGLGTAAIYNVGVANTNIPVLSASGLPAVGGSALTSLPSIDTLSDVTISSATNGQVLSYNGTNWVNAAPGSAMSRVTVITSNLATYIPPAVASGVIEVMYLLSPQASGSITLTNIPAATNTGLKLHFKKTNGFLMNIFPASGETIDGYNGGTELINAWASLTLISNGTSWSII